MVIFTNFTYQTVYSNAYSTLTRQTRDQFDNICVTSNKLSIMNEYSSCCGASRHHIFDELCADCLEHCEFDEDYDELS